MFGKDVDKSFVARFYGSRSLFFVILVDDVIVVGRSSRTSEEAEPEPAEEMAEQ